MCDGASEVRGDLEDGGREESVRETADCKVSISYIVVWLIEIQVSLQRVQ